MKTFKTTTHFIRKLSFIFLLAFSFTLTSYAQTTLVPGDIMVLQIDKDDKFIFVTFVELEMGTTIYFTDCGVFPTTGLFTSTDYPACTEGATKFVAAAVIEAGSIFQYGGSTPELQFSSHTDNIITGSIDLSFRGDQVIVFQDATSPGGSTQPSANPSFIFIVSSGAGNFTSHPLPFVSPEDPAFPNDGSGTSVPLVLTEANSPAGSATALAVGSGGGDFDYAIFDGTGLVPFTSDPDPAVNITNAKIAIVETANTVNVSDGVNWYGITTLDQAYQDYETLLLGAVNILPVELTSFNGRPKVKSIDLQWVTASELNNDYFTVQKSTNGIDFEKLTNIAGRGTTNLETHYNWVDQSPTNGLNYYRLLQVDLNEDKSYSDIIVIEFKADRDEIQLYPNPTVRELNINLPENWVDETSIVIYDFYGKVISSFTITSGSLTFPVDNIPAGIYRLSATNKNKILNTSFVKK